MQTATQTYTYVTYIKTTPEKLWNALSDPEMTRIYWGQARRVSDWKQGSTWTHQKYNDSTHVTLSGTVLESEPPKRLVISWVNAGEEAIPGKTSRVAFDITPMEDTIKLTVIHDELDDESARGISQGWPLVLSSLKTLLETGDALSITKQCFCGTK